MSADFELVVLDCPSCGAPLAGEDEDLVYYCTACRSGFRVAEGAEDAEGTGERLLPVEVSFIACPAVAPELHRPFWLLPATVEILERKGSGDFFRGLVRLFVSGGESEAADGRGRFAIPAFRAPLDRRVELALRYTFELPELGELPREKLTGGCSTVTDAKKLAEFVLIASEARKSDMLEELRYRLSFSEPTLLGVPCVRRDGELRDALFGLPV